MKNPFKDLTKFEFVLWLSSVFVITLCFLLAPDKYYLTLIASLIGVTALIFVAKGYIIGQILCVIFALFYGVISFYFRYYGEMITYLCMSAPIAVISIISWAKNPYKDSAEVTVHRMTKGQIAVMFLFAAVVTVAFYFILKALGTANLIVSTLSVTTSFLVSWLTFMRSPYYALAYALNDIVLIVLWLLASIENIAYAPMIACFVMFLLNDVYGFLNWKRMQARQKEE